MSKFSVCFRNKSPGYFLLNLETLTGRDIFQRSFTTVRLDSEENVPEILSVFRPVLSVVFHSKFLLFRNRSDNDILQSNKVSGALPYAPAINNFVNGRADCYNKRVLNCRIIENEFKYYIFPEYGKRVEERPNDSISCTFCFILVGIAIFLSSVNFR